MRSILALFLLMAAFAAGAQAQAALGFGGISGSILDDYGDGIPDVRVVLTNPKLGLERRFSTTDDGIFNFTSLIPSTGYSIKATRKGYGDFEIRNIEVNLGQIAGFLFSIQPEEPARSLDASEMIPQGEMFKMGATAEVTQRQMADLPVPGRRWDLLTDLVFPARPANSTEAALNGGISQPSVLINPNPTYQEPTGRLESPMLLVDGVDQTNYYMVKRDTPLILPQESVQEAEVISKNYASEYPGSLGGIVSVVTRSGENQLHTSLYGSWRDQRFNATDRYAPGFNPNMQEKQAGFSLSGPLIRKKLFFYANGEYLQGSSFGLNTITNQLIADPLGKSVNLSNCTATASQCAAAASFINSQMNQWVPRRKLGDFGFAKIDYRRSDRHMVSVNAGASKLMDQMNARTDLVAPDGGLIGQNGNVRHDTRYINLSWTSKPTTHSFNDMRFGWARDILQVTDSPWLFPSTGPLGILVAGASIGAPPMYPATMPDQKRKFFSESFSIANNTHTARVGVNIQRMHYVATGANYHGTYSYPTLTAFAQDFSGVTSGRKTYTSYFQQLGDDVRIFPLTVLNGYAQDTWRILSRIMLSYGLSWERPFGPKAPAEDAVQYWTGRIELPNINAMPRLGLAVRINDSTVVRGSWSMFYAPYSAEVLDAQILGNALILPGFTVTPQMTAASGTTQNGAVVFPNTYTWFGGPPSGSRNSFYGMHKLRMPHSNQEMVAIQHSFDPSTSLTLSAMMSKAYDLWNITDLNLVAPSKGATYGVYNAAGKGVMEFNTPIWTQLTNTNYAHIYRLENSATASYAGLTLEFRRRMLRSLSFQAAYTWSHAIDDLGNPINGIAGSNTYNGNPDLDRGPSRFDRRQSANISFVWAPAVDKNLTPIVRHLLNNWQVSGLATVATGLPFTPTIMVQGQQLSGSTMIYTNSPNGSGGWNRVPWQPIGSLRAQTMYPVNLRLTRSLPFGERLKAQLSFEAYNAFNMQYDTSVNTIAYLAAAAALRPVAGLGAGNSAWGWIDGTNARRAQVSLRITF